MSKANTSRLENSSCLSLPVSRQLYKGFVLTMTITARKRHARLHLLASSSGANPLALTCT